MAVTPRPLRNMREVESSTSKSCPFQVDCSMTRDGHSRSRPPLQSLLGSRAHLVSKSGFSSECCKIDLGMSYSCDELVLLSTPVACVEFRPMIQVCWIDVFIYSVQFSESFNVSHQEVSRYDKKVNQHLSITHLNPCTFKNSDFSTSRVSQCILHPSSGMIIDRPEGMLLDYCLSHLLEICSGDGLCSSLLFSFLHRSPSAWP